MYAISLTFLLAAALTLFIGFVEGGTALIYVSIAASVAAASFLGLAVLRRPPPGRDGGEAADEGEP